MVYILPLLTGVDIYTLSLQVVERENIYLFNWTIQKPLWNLIIFGLKVICLASSIYSESQWQHCYTTLNQFNDLWDDLQHNIAMEAEVYIGAYRWGYGQTQGLLNPLQPQSVRAS